VHNGSGIGDVAASQSSLKNKNSKYAQ